MNRRTGPTPVERVQTGIRLEKRILKVAKGLAEYLDLSLGDLLEGVLLHSFEGKAPFSRETQQKIGDLRKVYGLTLTARDSHRLTEAAPAPRGRETAG
ncbi:MAG: hypothetical protein KGN76_16790 [Acidobacteriota bacterium]|nr:hypothetical protein [Acidobacteriota bacterium]